ncbi:XRE family transcriptional regulator [Terrarubrum flagellatum]|uniref:helix-turn-helix domain-containing protein n=1 Tax=Terrirubrum flagellatum TaxID=2895980 RepID=UPI0031450D1E
MVETRDIATLNRQIAERVKRRRLERELTLDALAAESGVSRAMISKIERGEVSPTAPLLAKLANGLGLNFSSMFDSEIAMSPMSRRDEQSTWRDPATGYLRRNVSPRGFGAPMELVEVEMPPGARVIFEQGYPAPLARFVWLLDGELEVTIDNETHHLDVGDCLHMRLDAPLTFHNPGSMAARYALVTETAPRNR